MSLPPPPPPGGPPIGPGGYGPPPPMPPRGPDRTLPLVVGAVLGVVDAVGTGIVGLGFMVGLDNGLWFFGPPVVGLAIPLVLLSRPATRWWGVGLLIGFCLAVIVVGGSCVALIMSLGG